MTLLVEHVCQAMAQIAPLRLAEDWDNVGLLLGDRWSPARRVMTCLTITLDVVAEAEDEKVDLIIAHHPFPFKAVNKITTDSPSGGLLWRLSRAGISLYSAHTAMDSAAGGINEQWAAALGLTDVKPMIPDPSDPQVGSGRVGKLTGPVPETAAQILDRAVRFCAATRPRLAGVPDRPVRRVGVACGSGGSFVSAAMRAGCDLLLTGEATFHACLEAENTGISLGMVGHYYSERFAMDELARRLRSLPLELQKSAKMTHPDPQDYQVWASRREKDVFLDQPMSVDRS
ncbi:Nif3-like dinuclear metal center hexameric protein [Neorhodopirellula pilleata]|uniref:GTP cyclohydrolase 1 type 2 homolog n=1 Tax=Neorhodopirellula pilleata TaxID=2714738 RepID=A0A5C5ZMZ9_9BACT|nr:Nif3-like dinuclear metal center hexameric protein [Neorhodopirellula pilleata]TWT87823.1 GTP cyclohydrolase 1 type 2 [Neorhodopirellula pilleata]